MLTVLVDYDSGNLHSAQKAFERMAAEVGGGAVIVTSRPEDVARADRVVLPGDGAFPACRHALGAVDGMIDALTEAVQTRAVPFMGICVGMQMLATVGREYADTAGLDWIGGEVVPIAPDDPSLKVPHMGWNDLVVEHPHPVLDGVTSGDHAYFVHSYQFRLANPADRLAHVAYGGDVTAIVAKGNVIGTQFHPEKSQATGLRMIANFLRWRP
ncbi:MAG: imidazole glycerol phosphate synthase glutamine amidotransferase subunit HisH [Roseibaca calidilacus]|uniref:Imidazole glycerol phosphate synthase subunit HisH n=1 Tax=Roseibaca calidilacus TaxID=1666912 RepID=A0A0P8A7A9_9RHOB|nr:imidazole glycerol phosphate synthase subunit HisH [Roseibaca calidilacus]KPP90023.1 MAG: imidazole glycerol phosphate synthase glutamine amidotransferase subunit HisH [Roseibaca calidilacus]CUX81128.1 imidazole glycerol phosphate synthase subunit hisH [Roseibaca calidilacus]